MKFFDRVLLYLLVGATLSVALLAESGEPIGAKAAPAAVTVYTLLWPIILVEGLMSVDNIAEARKKAARSAP